MLIALSHLIPKIKCYRKLYIERDDKVHLKNPEALKGFFYSFVTNMPGTKAKIQAGDLSAGFPSFILFFSRQFLCVYLWLSFMELFL